MDQFWGKTNKKTTGLSLTAKVKKKQKTITFSIIMTQSQIQVNKIITLEKKSLFGNGPVRAQI